MTQAAILADRRIAQYYCDGATNSRFCGRALKLLEELRDSEPGSGSTSSPAVSGSTHHRLAPARDPRGGGHGAARSGRGPFRLGLALVTYADRVLSRLDVQALGRPLLVELMERTGETATLSLPGEHEAITVDSVPSRASVVSMARLGRPSVLHATSVGKVMLAFGGARLPRERDLRPLTPRTITDRADLASEIRAVRERGYGTVFGEREVDVNAIAAPVFGRGGELAAILGVQGPAVRLPEPATALEPLLEAAAALTKALGGHT